MPNIFNSFNAKLSPFVNETVSLKVNDSVFEIGFGTGKLINEMAEITTEGIIEGIDFSEGMLKQATLINIIFKRQSKAPKKVNVAAFHVITNHLIVMFCKYSIFLERTRQILQRNVPSYKD